MNNEDSKHIFSPERWLLIGPDQGWCEKAKNNLSDFVKRLPQTSFLAWRLQHQLFQVLTPDTLDETLNLALKERSPVRRSAMRLWAAMSESDWYAKTSDCRALREPSARGLDVTLIDPAPEGLQLLMDRADQPDTLARLTWLTHGRPVEIIPQQWLALGPLPERDDAQNQAMAEAGLACYRAWTESVSAAHDLGELEALWRPWPEPLVKGEPGDDSGSGAVPVRASAPELLDGAWNEPVFALAAASEDSGSEHTKWELNLVQAMPGDDFKGACHLQASVYRPSDGLPCVRFVATWRGPVPATASDARLLVTPSGFCRPSRLVHNNASSGEQYLTFDWPQSDWPSPDLLNQEKFRDTLDNARISLM